MQHEPVSLPSHESEPRLNVLQKQPECIYSWSGGASDTAPIAEAVDGKIAEWNTLAQVSDPQPNSEISVCVSEGRRPTIRHPGCLSLTSTGQAIDTTACANNTKARPNTAVDDGTLTTYNLCKVKLPGDSSEAEPPVPISNTAVKRFSADDTALARVWENRPSPGDLISALGRMSAPPLVMGLRQVPCLTVLFRHATIPARRGGQSPPG